MIHRDTRGQAPLSPLDDPANTHLVGLVLLPVILGLPGALLLLAIAALVMRTAQRSRARDQDPDPEFSDRFRDLENSIVDS